MEVRRVVSKSVAPLVGAWIEISDILQNAHLFASLPSWERGLKFNLHLNIRDLALSLPSWERRLKSKRQSYIMYYVIT